MPQNESLRRQRILRNWRQEDIAQQLDIPQSTVQRWERGIHHPSAYYRVKLCALFNLSPQDLGLVEDPQSSPQEEREERPSQDNPFQEFAVWTIPHTRNVHFTGREDILERIMHLFSTAEVGQRGDPTALPRAYALKGLGGIGETQIAVEYAYRAREQRRYTHILWVTATSEESILTSFTVLAQRLPAFASRDVTDQRKLVAMVIDWMEQCPQPWLLIIDNADNIALVHPYVPHIGNGCILFTTRASAVSTIASSLDVDNMSIPEGTTFLLRRVGLSQADLSHSEMEKATCLVVTLAQFPLALDQAGAYIEETKGSFSSYLQLYETYRQTLLARRGMQMTLYPYSVATTWSLAFEHVEHINPAAAELLRLCAFCAPDAIPEELLTRGVAHWTPLLQEAVTDQFNFNQMLETLLAFSLIKRSAENSWLSLHQLVQVVQVECMTPQEQRQWAERLMYAVNAIFPDGKGTETWSQCQRYLAQVEVCSLLIEQWNLISSEAGRLLHQAGVYARIRAQYAQAERWLAQAHALRQHVRGTEHVEVAESLKELAALYQLQGKYKEAEPLYLRSLTIQEHLLGAEHLDIAASLNGLGLVYWWWGRYKEAESLYLRSLAIQEHLLGAEHSDTGANLNGLGLVYWWWGRYKEAEPLLLRAMRVEEQQLGPEHPNIATSLSNLGLVYWSWGRYKEAEPLLLRAMRIGEQQLGPEHPYVATSLSNLALVYLSWGRYKEAEPLLLRAMRIEEQQLGPEHPYAAINLSNLALVHWSWGRYKEAEPLLLRAVRIGEQQLGPEHAYVAMGLNNLALVYWSWGRYKEVEPLLLRAVHIVEQRLGPEHPEMASCLNGLARLYTTQRKYEEAEPLLLRALALRENQLGAESPAVAESLNGLACLYADQRKYEEAEPLFQRALALRENQLGAESPAVAESLNGLACLYADQRKYEEAEPLFQRALALRENQLGAEHPDTVTTRTCLRSLYKSQK